MSLLKKSKAPQALRYVGEGRAIIGVPARDLSADEAAQYDQATLLASGLYAVAPAATEEETDGTRT